MSLRKSKILLASTTVLLLLSIIFLAAALGGDEWLKFGGVEFGLRKYCVPQTAGLKTPCSDRDNIFKFESTPSSISAFSNKDLDLILILIIVSVVFAFIALIIAVVMFCIKGETTWRCNAAASGSLALIGGFAGLGGLALFESRLESNSSGYDHLWASILTWVGVFLLVVSSVMAFIMICVRPKPDYSNQGHIVYGQNNVVTYNKQDMRMDNRPPTHDNRGYDREDDFYYNGRQGGGGYRGESGDGGGRRHQPERRSHEEQRGYRSSHNNQSNGHDRRQRPYEIRPNEDRQPSYDNDGYYIR